MLAPAMMPVAAGKKTAKTIQKSAPEKPFSTEPRQSPQRTGVWPSPQPAGLARISTRDTAMTPMITYWILKAKSALT